MQKILIIGCPGSGKSTFARALRDKTRLPLYYLDQLWHKSDRTTVSEQEFDRRLEEILRGERWIIDGNYLRTLEARLQRCDTVLFLDFPLEVCLAGVRERVGRKREDLPWVETELDEEFRQWICDFARTQRPRMDELLQKYAPGREILVFKTREELAAWPGPKGNAP